MAIIVLLKGNVNIETVLSGREGLPIHSGAKVYSIYIYIK
jgi:hypothetical protein